MLKVSINLKTKLLYLFFRTIMKPVNSDQVVCKEEICINSSKISIVSSSSFNIFKVNIEDSIYYFRECKPHIKFKKYIERCLDDYYMFYHNKELVRNKELIYNELLSKKTLKCLYKMGTENDTKSYTYLFFKNKNLEVFNLKKLSSINFDEIFKLINYIKGNVNCYRFNSGIKKSNYEVFSLDKSMAYITLTKLLGLNHLVPETKIIKLYIDNKIIKYGTLMKCAEGISPLSMTLNERKLISPNFHKDINNLNLIDVIAIDKDHRPSNYMIKLKNNKVDSLQVFDIDYPTSFFITLNINMITGLGSGPLIDNKYIFNIPYLDINLTSKLININYSTIKRELSLYLSNIQILFLYLRIKKIKIAINKSIKKNKLTLLNDDEWNEEKLKNELNSCKNPTYTKIFIEKCK